MCTFDVIKTETASSTLPVAAIVALNAFLIAINTLDEQKALLDTYSSEEQKLTQSHASLAPELSLE